MSGVGADILVFIDIGRVFVVAAFFGWLVFSGLLMLVDLVSELLSKDL